jgi:hypothetical protein
MASLLRRFPIALAFLGFAPILPANVGAQCSTYLTQWGSFGSGDGQFNLPVGVAMDAAGDVYVADVGNSRIQKFSNTGTYITQWGSPGSGNGQLNFPQGVATDADENVYVADTGNHRIQKFSNTGTYITQWGSPGSGDGQFNNPAGMATDAAGDVYVADRLNNRIQKFSNTGTYLLQWGSQGTGNGQFIDPSGVATDADGYVYVADTNNHRIQKFSNTGTYLLQWGSQGTGNGQFTNPHSVATDGAGDVYVTDVGNNRVQKFTGTGSYVCQWGTSGIGDGQFNSPQGVALDADGNVYVGDVLNYRIQKFGPSNNLPPDCSGAYPSVGELWPPKHQFQAVDILGVTDPDGNPVTITVTGITQDEPLITIGGGTFCPDGQIIDGRARLRVERTGTPWLPGNGRVYVIAFTADDEQGGTCQGQVSVCVPHDQRPGHVCIDDGQTVNSLGPCGPSLAGSPNGPGHDLAQAPAGEITEVQLGAPKMFNGDAVITYALPEDSDVHLAVFDIAGRHVATIDNSRQTKGRHEVTLDTGRMARGVYFYRIQAAGVSLSRPLVLTR